MSLTKKDKEEITRLIKQIIGESQTDNGGQVEVVDKAQEIQMQIDKWDAKAISTGLGFVIAPENYYEGDKQHFTWDEAMDIQEKIKASGWRLPTVAEWVQLYGRFGIDAYGHDDPDALSSQLLLKKDGYVFNGVFFDNDSYGFYWSSTADSPTDAYRLYFNSNGVNPQDYELKTDYGYSVRMIKEVKNEQ